MTSFELEYRKIEGNPYRHQLNNIFPFIMEEFLETLEAADAELIKTRSPDIIELLFNRNFGNIFHYQKLPTIANMCINTQVENINPHPFKHQRTSHIYT